MLSKSQLQDLLRKYQYYVKLSVLAKEFGISQPGLSIFIKYGTCSISLDKLNKFYEYVTSKVNII